jgi:serine/threonine protein kinase
MEYCPNGSLQEFLQNNHSQYSVEEESLNPDLSQVFGPKHLIHFAWQIAKGMTFLTSRKVKFPHPCIRLTVRTLYVSDFANVSPQS